MNDNKIRTQIHNAVDQYCAKYEVKDDPYLAQRVLNTSHALPGDVHPYPRSETLRRLSGDGEQTGGDIAV